MHPNVLGFQRPGGGHLAGLEMKLKYLPSKQSLGGTYKNGDIYRKGLVKIIRKGMLQITEVFCLLTKSDQ